MKNQLIDIFSLHYEKEDHQIVISNITGGVGFRGTNLWILIFAIFVASLGLNVNSTAVIIGAMLISPLMGPIMGIGLGIGINDFSLLRKAISNYLIATLVALLTSTLFFLISPLNDAHSEILARTSPTIYDVLIALFGGFAGIIATSSKQKGNVIPGVAIATALMPPLCTAGYGLATLQFQFFFGSFYLFIINTVFIALATLVMVRFLHFPQKLQQDERTEKLAKRLIWLVVVVTLVPSIYFGYDLVKQNRFEKEVARFIMNEAHFTNDYLLNKKVDAKNKSIVLVFGGKEISAAEIDELKVRLKKYDLKDAQLEIKQGFAYLSDNMAKKEDKQVAMLTQALGEKEKQGQDLLKRVDSVNNIRHLSDRIYKELMAQYPTIRSAIIEQSILHNNDTATKKVFLVVLTFPTSIPEIERRKIQRWLSVRLEDPEVALLIRQ
jgi:uncharacterized hydrophobic protein (TIGR00271 family)